MTVYIKRNKLPNGQFTFKMNQDIYDRAGIDADYHRYIEAVRNKDMVYVKRVQDLLTQAIRDGRIKFI